MAFNVDTFLAQFQTVGPFNAYDTADQLRSYDKPIEHVMADVIEAQQDIIKELTTKLYNATHKRPKRLPRK